MNSSGLAEAVAVWLFRFISLTGLGLPSSQSVRDTVWKTWKKPYSLDHNHKFGWIGWMSFQFFHLFWYCFSTLSESSWEQNEIEWMKSNEWRTKSHKNTAGGEGSGGGGGKRRRHCTLTSNHQTISWWEIWIWFKQIWFYFIRIKPIICGNEVYLSIKKNIIIIIEETPSSCWSASMRLYITVRV